MNNQERKEADVNVKRYEFTIDQKGKFFDLREKVDGRFVLFTDHQQAIEAKEKQIEHWKSHAARRA